MACCFAAILALAFSKAASTFLNIHPMKIWPERYDEKGNPLLQNSLNHFPRPVKKKQLRSNEMIKQYYSI